MNLAPGPASPQPVVELRQVCKAYGAHLVIRDLSFEVAQGEVFAILGSSGCGKTTTLRLIAGFDTVDRGEIRLNGELVASAERWVPPEKRGVGIVFQEYALFPHLTVEQNVAFGLGGFPKEQRQAILRTMLEMVGMAAYARHFPYQLSGGQQQRVALARSLAPCPVVLLLDEPFSNLDADLRAQVRQEVKGILREAQTTTLLVTHDQEEAFLLADRVGVMNQGRLEQVDTPEGLYHRPATRFVAGFVGEGDFLPGRVGDGVVVTELGLFPYDGPLPPGAQAEVMFRPDDVLLQPHSEGIAVISRRQFRGSENRYTIRLPSGETLTSSQSSTTVLSLGQPVKVWAEPSHVVAFPRNGDSAE